MRRLSRLPLVIAAALACAAPAPLAPGWRILGPGGGGSLYHPTISPHDSRTALVACDMTGAYLTRDGGATWRIFNLGETVRSFLFDPIDPNVIYATGDGVFRTGEAGRSLAPAPKSPRGSGQFAAMMNGSSARSEILPFRNTFPWDYSLRHSSSLWSAPRQAPARRAPPPANRRARRAIPLPPAMRP